MKREKKGEKKIKEQFLRKWENKKGNPYSALNEISINIITNRNSRILLYKNAVAVIVVVVVVVIHS